MDQREQRPGPVSSPADPGRGRFHWPTFAVDAALVTGGALTANILNYVFHFALSRALGPDGYGSLATLFAIAMIAGVAGSSIGTVAMQETARRYARQQDESIASFGWSMLRPVAAAGAIIGLVALLLSIPLSRYLHITDTLAWIDLSIALFGGLVAAFARGAIQGAHRFGFYAASIVGESTLKLVVGFMLATAGLGVGGAMGGVAIGVVAGAAIALSSLLRGGPGHDGARPIARFGPAAIKLAFIYAAMTALLYIDIVFAKHGLAGDVAGFYSAAGQMARILPFGVGLVVPLVTPKAVAASHAGRGELAHLLAVTFGASMAGALAVLGAMELWPNALIAVTFGPKFSASAPLLRVYAIDGLLLSICLVGSSYLAAMGEYGIVPWLSAAVVFEAVAMAVWGDSPARLLGIAIAGNALVVAPIVAYVARSVRRVPQAPDPKAAEEPASLPH
jgi:O-antigen/teichoic acid export membrane protein